MYIADLHIHSRYSRATSKDCTPESLDLWARRKGISIVGTGDFTHPAWREELSQKLVPAEEGFYTLKEEYRIKDSTAGAAFVPRFVLSGEISSIYKKNGKVRKVHSVILLPSLEDAEKLSKKLESIGNIHSDGRPILGLDCRDLLEITLELCPRAIYIPAHIWTPHFSLFGAFSGFDTIEECFGDLAPHIHALETGLSSDPPMNWRLSALDGYQLISNSDAHSPAKLGREANLLDIPLCYDGLSEAIQTGKGLSGTIEFFPEEGKYHFDGHRKCKFCLAPSQAAAYFDKCPVCGKKLTIGVLHRVEQLADRGEGFALPGAKPFESLAPLPEVIAASTGQSAAGKRVQASYEAMLHSLGSEFSILREVPVEDIRKAAGSSIAEGIRRLRMGQVERTPGYDGEYGAIRLMDSFELDSVDGQMSLFDLRAADSPAADTPAAGKAAGNAPVQSLEKAEPGSEDPNTAAGEAAASCLAGSLSCAQPEALNPAQSEAVAAVARAIAVIAGPGTGKTKTLIARIRHLLEGRGVRPSEITAVTFTNKAAAELKDRLESGGIGKRKLASLTVGTFHSICMELLKQEDDSYRLADEAELAELAGQTIEAFLLPMKPGRFLQEMSAWKSGCPGLSSLTEEVAGHYQALLAESHLMDFDDILLKTLALLEDGQGQRLKKAHFSYLLVDEFQDVSPVQYRLLQAWNQGGRELFVIGDPDQAIYGFRGANPRIFEQLNADYPDLNTIRLAENYRSTPCILNGALGVINKNPGPKRSLHPHQAPDTKCPIRFITAPGDMSQAIFIAKEINRIVGGISMLDTDYQEGLRESFRARGFSDIAVLYRTHRQELLLEKCLARDGIPYVVVGRGTFLEEPVVRGALCFFRYLLNPEDTRSLSLCERLLPGLDRQRLQEKYSLRAEKTRPRALMDSFIRDLSLTGSEPMNMLAGMTVFHKTMAEFLHALDFGAEGDLKRCAGKSYPSDAVTLTTLHGAKGLEYPIVFLSGVNEGLIPMDTPNHAGSDEERRLFYVGMTRAREELILLSSKEPSPFLKDIPKEVLLTEDIKKEPPKEESQQMSLFDFMTNG